MTRRMMTLVMGLGLIVSCGRGYGQEDSAAPKAAGQARRAGYLHRLERRRAHKGPWPPAAATPSPLGSRSSRRVEMRPTSAAATIFALSVTDSRSFCFGGEVPILFYDAKHQTVTVIDGQGAAPRLATLDHFKGPAGIPAKGIEPAAVPAALDACLTLLDRFGTMTFTQVIAPTKELLKHRPRPEPWHADLLRTLEPARIRRSRSEQPLPEGRPSEGRPLPRSPPGRRRVLSRPDRPAYRRLGEGERLVDPLRRSGHAHDPPRRTRLDQLSRLDRLQMRRLDQGPALLEALQILEGFDLKAMGHNRPDAIHTITEIAQAGPRRSRHVLRRPSLRRCPARGLALARLRRAPPRN